MYVFCVPTANPARVISSIIRARSGDMVVSFIEVPAGNLMPTDRKDTPNSPPTSLPGALGDSRSVQLTSLSESDSGRGGMFLPLVHQGPNSLRRIRPGSPGGRRRRRTWTCRLKAAGDGPTNALIGLLIMQVYALLAAARGAFG